MFSEAGTFISRWGARGRLPGQLQRPTGLAITKEGLVAVSDYENKCVSLFDLDGKYRTRIGAGKLLGPKGLAVTKLRNGTAEARVLEDALYCPSGGGWKPMT